MIEASTCRLWRECNHSNGKQQCRHTCHRAEWSSGIGAVALHPQRKWADWNALRRAVRQLSPQLPERLGCPCNRSPLVESTLVPIGAFGIGRWLHQPFRRPDQLLIFQDGNGSVDVRVVRPEERRD